MNTDSKHKHSAYRARMARIAKRQQADARRAAHMIAQILIARRLRHEERDGDVPADNGGA
ncbi:hypothetical protein [Roseomonas genomospecies 6]|uniref:Uncharacterized protein n=1 Tax=Roseomonas genomospecies 6 TaxID=214106 RepID=A0A9W7NLG8_9PROT|nr:hypothetical protein [Roseomonas genomospecies 6]KAA0682204.1 hypothetical protein DS843_06570 [Roseomonas genomospecies 6]